MSLKQKINQFLYQHEFLASWLRGVKWTAAVFVFFAVPIYILAELDINGHQTIEAWLGISFLCFGGGLLWAWFDNL